MSVLQTLEREAASTPENNPKPPANRRTWKRVFLRALAQHGSVTQAAQAAGVHRRHAGYVRSHDPRFARKWAEAIRESDRVIVDRAEAALLDRAVNGRSRTIMHKGNPIEVEDKPSDKCLELLLKARRPRKYDRRATSHGNTTTVICPQSMQIAFLTQPDVREAVLAFESAMAASKSPTPASPPSVGLPSIEV